MNIGETGLRRISLMLPFLLGACGIINSAAELLFGEGQLPRIEQDMLWPDPNELSGLDEEEQNSTPGFPSDLSEGSLAHLVGALAAQGDCQRIVETEEDALSPQVKGARFQLTACGEDDRCAAECDDGFLGLKIESSIKMEIMSAEQAAEILQNLSEQSAGAVEQIRFRFETIEFFQGLDAERSLINQYIDNYELYIGTESVEPELLLEQAEVYDINSAPQRYELPRNEPLAEDIVSRIFARKSVVLELIQRFRIRRDYLYRCALDDAGVRQVLQPEVVINAIEVATSNL